MVPHWLSRLMWWYLTYASRHIFGLPLHYACGADGGRIFSEILYFAYTLPHFGGTLPYACRLESRSYSSGMPQLDCTARPQLLPERPAFLRLQILTSDQLFLLTPAPRALSGTLVGRGPVAVSRWNIMRRVSVSMMHLAALSLHYRIDRPLLSRRSSLSVPVCILAGVAVLLPLPCARCSLAARVRILRFAQFVATSPISML
jgi:hypothetical protein